MKLKTKIKWKFYNSLLSVFLINKFQIWIQFSISEIKEIPLFNNHLEDYILELKKEYGHNVSYSLELEYKNIVNIWFIDSNKQKIKYISLGFDPYFNFNKYKL